MQIENHECFLLQVGSTYPLEAAQAAAAVAAWRERMPPQVFARVARGKRLVKEVIKPA
jgi:hypothetical protein